MIKASAFYGLLLSLLLPVPSWAGETVTLDLKQAINRAHNFDPRIAERQKLIGVARGQLQEAVQSENWIYDFNLFVGMAPKIRGGFFEGADGRFDPGSLDFQGVSPWYNLDFTVLRPLATFGKVEEYAKAARNNIKIIEGDVEIERANIYIDVVRAYYGYLAAKDIETFLVDILGKVEGALSLVTKWLEDGAGNAKESDIHALQTGVALVNRYIVQAQGASNIAYAGLRLLAGISRDQDLALADTHIVALPLPEEQLEALQALALKLRPEMMQVEEGLSARRALVAAANAEFYPNLYTGVGGSVAYSPERDRTDEITVYDPFNHAGLTPVIGLKWDWHSGVQKSHVTQKQAELDALIEKKAFAQLGIPFQVAEQYYEVHAHYKMIQELKQGSLAGRRWMVTAYADFEAGLETSALAITALQAYVAAYSDYLRIINDYNVHVARLWVATGELK